MAGTRPRAFYMIMIFDDSAVSRAPYEFLVSYHRIFSFPLVA
jgi:hypothetical protein